MTRALQTAMLVGAELRRPVTVVLDLREWLPDETYQWTTVAAVLENYAEMLSHVGKPRPAGATWEPLEALRHRARRALAPYVDGNQRVLAVCHEVLIQALTGERRTGYAGVRPYPS